METNRKSKRWLRFSLRSFLIVLTIFCVWLGWFLYRVEQQRKAVRWVEENGGTVLFSFEIPKGIVINGAEPPGPIWLHDILGVDYFSCVVSVDCNRQINDLQPLAGLKNVESLNLYVTLVSDSTPLAGLKNLHWLKLECTQVSDSTPLAGLNNLEHLWLGYTQVIDKEIEKLQLALPNCRIYH